MYVYFIVATNQSKRLLKIGKSRDVARRLSQVQVGCPYKIFLMGTIKTAGDPHAYHLEGLFHQRFRKFRTNSRGEWFRLTKAVEEECIRWIAAGDVAAAR